MPERSDANFRQAAACPYSFQLPGDDCGFFVDLMMRLLEKWNI
jgi:hypothetical protein